jgi:hypothetical protein
MKLLRRLFAAVCVCSLLFWLIFGFLRLRSASTMDVWMLPLPAGKTLLITSHRENFLELTLLKDWPFRQFSHWSGPEWLNVGPFHLWQMHHPIGWNPHFLGFHPLGQDGIWGHEGSYVSPRAFPNGPPAFINSHDRGEALGFGRGVPWGSPDWYFGYARELKFPFHILMRYAAILPCLWLMTLLLHIRRQRRRRLQQLCLNCGYDLRASTDQCPECGQPIPTPLTSPPSPLQTPSSPVSAIQSPALPPRR